MSKEHETERLRYWARRTSGALDAHVDLDAVRGWAEPRDPSLDAAHALPPLLSLESPDGAHQSLHGPRALIGRFSPHHGPVDLTPMHLYDHELYRLSAPHALLELTSSGWTARSVSPRVVTAISGRELRLGAALPLVTGDTLTLGVHTWRVTAHEDARARWERAREELLGADLEPSLFLSRFGAICGPRHILSGRRPHVLGRAFSLDGHAAPAQPDWDLCGLPERERRYVAFRHAELRPVGARDWEVASLGARQRVYVNRVAVDDEPVLLTPGDEVGLGAITFLFHNPLHEAPLERAEPDLPEVVDWDRDHTSPRQRPLSIPREEAP